MLRGTVPPAHSFLRRATSRLHGRIDQTPVLAALTNPGVTLDIYRTAMLALRRAYEEIDCLLLKNAGLCPEDLPQYVARIPLISRDLSELGVTNPGDSRATGFELRSPDTEAAYLGMRYVVEGAQLGSRFIHRHLHAAFGDDLRDFGSFWMPGSVLQGSWPEVLKSLAQMESRASLATAVHAARRTFQHMEHQLAAHQRETS